MARSHGIVIIVASLGVFQKGWRSEWEATMRFQGPSRYHVDLHLENFTSKTQPETHLPWRVFGFLGSQMLRDARLQVPYSGASYPPLQVDPPQR